MTRAQYVAERLYAELKRRGHLVTLRTPSVTAGSMPQPNPARAGALTLAGSHLAGTTSIALTSSNLAGRFVAGDTLTIKGQVLPIATTATASNNAATVTTVIPLAANTAGGTAVTVGWSADRLVYAQIEHQGSRLEEKQDLVETRSYGMTIANWNLGVAPTLRDLVMLADGNPRKVIAVQPQMVDGHTASYRLQLRW